MSTSPTLTDDNSDDNLSITLSLESPKIGAVVQEQTDVLDKIKTHIEDLILMTQRHLYEGMISRISSEHNISKEDLCKTLKDFEPENISRMVSHQPVNQHKCLGKTKYGIQCTRSRQNDSEFCGSHHVNLPYGKVDNSLDEIQIILKKRGRPKKK